MPGPEGEIYLTANTNREIVYPGLRLKFIRGPAPLDDDPTFLQLVASSPARLLLENLSCTRGTRDQARCVSVKAVEERLAQILRGGQEPALNAIRDRARQVAKQFGWNTEFERLDQMIGALQGTRPAKNLQGQLARARAAGEPYDPGCLERLHLLFGEIRGRPLPGIQDRFEDRFEAGEHFRNKAFFESYFSNFIEGTTFEVAEAEEILFNKKIPAQRPKDAHDIIGTFQIVSDQGNIRRKISDPDTSLGMMLERHRILMEARPETLPGRFKERPNRAGETVFVSDLVSGTLRKGLELCVELPEGLARAIFVLFLVSDVHPFVDGNGRIARIMMNSELFSTGQSTIIIPNVYREDYLLALRSLTRRHRPSPLVDLLVRAQRFSHLEFSPYPRILKELERRNWFREPDEAKIIEDE